MDFLEPELQQTYEKCKYVVKVWEHQFQKKHKRVPSKLDIKEANKDVRNAYRKYFQLKTTILEQSFKGVEGLDDIDNVNDTDANIYKATHLQDSTDETQRESLFEPETNIKTVWGPHLNNSKDINEFTKEKEKPTLNLNISKKLFCGSKFIKRNPRKSLSVSQKSKTNCNDNVSITQPTTSFSSFSSEEALSILQNDYSENSFMDVPHSTGTLSQPLNVVQSFFDVNPKNLKTVDVDWLKRIAQVTGTSQDSSRLILSNDNEEILQSNSITFDYDSDDIIENSDEEDSYKFTQISHVLKKRKIDYFDDSSKSNENSTQYPFDTDIFKENINNKEKPHQECKENVQQVNNDKLCLKQVFLATKRTKNNATDNTESGNTEKKKTNEIDIREISNENEKPKNKAELEKVPKKNIKKATSKQNLVTKKLSKKIMQTGLPILQRRSSRTTKLKASLKEFSSGEEDGFLTDRDEKDPEFQLEIVKQRTSAYEYLSDHDALPKIQGRENANRSFIKKEKKKNEANIGDSKDEDDRYDLEFSIKPRVVVSRYGSIKNILSEKKLLTKTEQSGDDKPEDSTNKGEIKDKRQQAKEKLQQRISSGSLNDNFVRINIKKKVFVRGKRGRNFSKFKKAQWKKAKCLTGPNMDMSGCDGGMLTCFNCGEVGHFAQNCKNTRGDSLLTLNENPEEECPFPTLEEASKMAQEGNLTTRKPKLELKEIQNLQNENLEESDNNIFDDEFDAEELLLETIKLEEHIRKLDVKMYMDNVTVVNPYYKLKEDGSIIDTPQEVFETLNKFGHSSFRPGQEQAIMRILSGKSTLVTLSTGSGKSLCYQLPAYLYSKREPCISLIISPLVSLMDDQILGIAKFMKAACLHSNQTNAQRKKILEAISLGELSILLVSPEAVVAGEKQKGFSSFLRKLPPIAFACIDEAHCVSQWSHNFRPSYLMICRVLRQSLGVNTILGLTATATKATQCSIIEHLQISDGEQGVISDIPLPDNLHLSVSKDINRDHALLSMLLSDRFKDCQSIIVYCTRRQECERIAGFLRTSLKSEQPEDEGNKKRKRVNLQAEPYHAGLSASRRRTIQNRFMSGQLRIVVATVAFGMGINKSDIRAVIHYNMPSSFESYVQEVGRAGRDGLPAQCHVFLDSKGGDENELRRHIHSNSIDHHVIRKLLEKIFIPCSCKDQCPKHEVAFSIESTVRALDIPEENISTLLCYLELHNNRYIELLSPAYTQCRVVSYSGPLQIRKVSKGCPPLAMALALHKNKDEKNSNILQFPIIDIASAMGWESGICKHKLKNLEWTTVNNQPKRSSITVEFSDLGFRLLAPGNLNGEQLDDALENLYYRVVKQERKALLQLNAIHQTLIQVAKPSFKTCMLEETDHLIKYKIREYFNAADPLKLVPEIEYAKLNEELLITDIHDLICMYRDNKFTGRAVARIFQGIQSPNYPAAIWGRCKFWRSHLDKDFHAIVKIAAKIIVRLR